MSYGRVRTRWRRESLVTPSPPPRARCVPFGSRSIARTGLPWSKASFTPVSATPSAWPRWQPHHRTAESLGSGERPLDGRSGSKTTAARYAIFIRPGGTHRSDVGGRPRETGHRVRGDLVDVG